MSIRAFDGNYSAFIEQGLDAADLTPELEGEDGDASSAPALDAGRSDLTDTVDRGPADGNLALDAFREALSPRAGAPMLRLSLLEGTSDGGAAPGAGDTGGPGAGGDRNLHELPGFPTHDQNQGNGGERACGTTSLSSIFDYFNPGAAGNDRASIDAAIRRGNVGASADQLAAYAEAHGYRAAIKDDASLDDIKQMIDQGVPVECNIDPDGGGNWNLHYVDVVGYKTDSSGKIAALEIMDPSGGQLREVDAATFMKQWSDIHIAGMSTGVNRQMITCVPDDGRTIRGLDGVARKASDIELPSDGWLGNVFSDAQPSRVLDDAKADGVNDWDKITSGQVFGGALGEVGALVKFVGAGVGFGLTNFVGRPLEDAGTSVLDWGTDRWENGGFLGKLEALAGWIGGGLLTGVGFAFSKIGDGLSWTVGKVGDAVGKVGDAIDSVAKGAWDAITSIF